MDKASNIASVCAYATSCGTGGYWFYNLINNLTPEQWAGIGVIVSIFFSSLTYITNLIFKIYAIKHPKKGSDTDSEG